MIHFYAFSIKTFIFFRIKTLKHCFLEVEKTSKDENKPPVKDGFFCLLTSEYLC